MSWLIEEDMWNKEGKLGGCQGFWSSNSKNRIAINYEWEFYRWRRIWGIVESMEFGVGKVNLEMRILYLTTSV